MIFFGARWNKETPSSLSKFLISLLMVDCETYNTSEAFVKLPWRATSAK